MNYLYFVYRFNDLGECSSPRIFWHKERTIDFAKDWCLPKYEQVQVDEMVPDNDGQYRFGHNVFLWTNDYES